MDLFQAVPGPASELYLRTYRSGPHENFHYVVGDPITHQAVIIDPAFHVAKIFEATKHDGYTIVAALFTHGHWDHIGGLAETMDLGAKSAYVHEAAASNPHVIAAADRVKFVRDQDIVHPAGLDIEALHTPGHQPDSTCFRVGDLLFTGDTLFIDTCGRTDFPGGNTDLMFQSMGRMREMPDAWVLPGHDYADRTFEQLSTQLERNPALRTLERDAFGRLSCLTN